MPVSFRGLRFAARRRRGEAERFCRGDDGASLLDFEEHLHASDVVDGHGVLLLSSVLSGWGAPVRFCLGGGVRCAG